MYFFISWGSIPPSQRKNVLQTPTNHPPLPPLNQLIPTLTKYLLKQSSLVIVARLCLYIIIITSFSPTTTGKVKKEEEEEVRDDPCWGMSLVKSGTHGWKSTSTNERTSTSLQTVDEWPGPRRLSPTCSSEEYWRNGGTDWVGRTYLFRLVVFRALSFGAEVFWGYYFIYFFANFVNWIYYFEFHNIKYRDMNITQ